MPNHAWLIGRRAERQAARFLKKLGYLIVERNVLVGRDELDLITVHNSIVVFVEVRFRSAGVEAAEFSVEGSKSRRLKRAVYRYRSQENLWNVPCRIDVIAVTKRDSRWQLSHIIDAY